ncbi:LysM peptidoglycan-binding domain-containing protein [Chryseomicrobium aureum]|uniref:LysM peptidoglycan-binding domain-containing protein n=1 Tax=Chryseomicrobium aureum TaxID=1441723 RepID=UPI00195D3DEB|nr:LysM peptidoglycan-binding domain-containing protein [Chryseomicrobium aureum]MBM7705497.1 LysM repeat protein [Chryseomicrobium aureum]
MANNDYQKRLDEHRKPIDEPVTATRRARHQKKIKKQSSKTPRSWFLPTLFTLGIISPIILFVYVSVFYNPLANEVPANQQVIQLDVQPVTPVQQEEEEEQEEQPVEEVEEVVEQEPVEQEPVEQEPVEEVQEPVQQPEPQQPAARTHTVQAGETLYRIAVTYYNDPSAVDRIKQANNLTSNEISTGQQLVLP